MWDLPGPGLEPVSPALAGRFLTTAPPGKPATMFFCFLVFNVATRKFYLLFLNVLFFIQFLTVTLHLQLLRNVGSIPCAG